MASFTPGINDVNVPDNTNVSQGTGPNKAFEALFSGLGDAIESGVNTADNFIQNSIDDDARNGFEALNKDMALDSDTIPAELTRGSESLTKLAQAHTQGRITSTYYYQQLAASLKAMRARYPGYDKQVDDIVQSVTGTRPANAFRDELLENMNRANNAAASSQDKFDSWVTQSGNIGYIQMTMPDYFENPGKYTQQEVIANVAKAKGQDQTWESQKVQLAGNKEFASLELNKRLNYLTASTLDASSRSLGVAGADFYNKLNQFSKTGMTPEEKALFTNQYEQFIAAARTKMIKETSDEAFVAQFTASELSTMREAALQPLLQIRDLIESDQYSQAARLVAQNKNLQEQAISGMYKADPDLLAGPALATISPDLAESWVNDLMQKRGGSLKYNEAVGISDVMSGIINGKDTTVEATNRIINDPAIPQNKKNQYVGGLVETFTSSIKSGKLTPEQIRDVVTNNYTVGADDLFKNVDTSTDAKGNSQYLRLYNDLFSPEVTKSIVASGDQAALKQYTDAAVDKFQAIPEFRKAAANLTENIEYSKYLRSHYDPATNRIILEADTKAINDLGFFTKGDGNTAGEKFQLRQAVKAKDAFNQALSIVAPIIEANGGDELEGIQQLMQSVALELQPDQKRGFFAWINEGLDKAVADLAKPVDGSKAAAEPKAESNFEEVGAASTESLDDDDPILWETPDIDPVKEVIDAGTMNYAPESQGGNAASAAIDGQLRTSTKRGYQPDMDNLDPDFKSAVSSLQSAFGKELPIVSGYRDPARNRKAGGAKRSRHQHGDAVDIDASNMSREERIKLIQMAREQGFGGVGIYANSIHLDKGAKRAWGPSHRNSSLPQWARDALGG